MVPDQALHEAPAEPETLGGQPVETLPGFRGFYPEAFGWHPLFDLCPGFGRGDEAFTHAGAGSGWP
jgi:hypothetical protein